MRDRAEAGDADSFAAQLRYLSYRRLHVQGNAERFYQRSDLNHVTAFEHVGDHRRPGHARQIRLARKHGLHDQRRGAGEHWIDFQSMLLEKLGFVGNQKGKTVIRDRRVGKFNFVERCSRFGGGKNSWQ